MSIADLLLMEIDTFERTKQKNMDIIRALLKEFEAEFNTTKKFMALVPADRFDWAPHQKSMKMKSLASHIAEFPEWVNLAFTTNGLDFASAPYEEKIIDSTEDLIKLLETSYKSGKAELEKAQLNSLDEQWILRNGEQILGDLTRYEMMRVAFSQTIHHRAQLGVYLRLLDIPIPGSYGPSADDQSF
ncbi:DinB family protein [Pedobacter frigidisoli]|uniref:DinB family protein n=1 Tax=Pedobacter frigidisoli TaxID=2530455 RepID=A0A4R0P504_9SPHI|nr:DinB family protein [Pedobacter frigidisoli]TCD10899.1 DinB family protein [Pedobacter frigidisoli]